MGCTPSCDEVGDAMREHPGLARAGAGDHQQRPAAMHDGIELVGVQRLQVERVEIELEAAVVAHGDVHPTEGVRHPDRREPAVSLAGMSRLRVVVFAAIGGALTGLISYAFLEALDWATRTRVGHGWIVWLLPVAGLVVGGAYHYWGGRAKGGTPAVIEQAHTFTHGAPARMAPMVFGGSVVGHLFGASVGREGAALQMAGSVTDTAARIGRLHPDERRTLIAASLAGGWGAVFGVPFTGIVFTMQVTRSHRWRALLPAIVAAFTGKWVVDALGYVQHDRPRLPATDWSFVLPLKLALVGVGFGLVGRLFVGLVKLVKRRVAHVVHWPPGRAVLGGVATLVLMVLAGRDYLGLSARSTPAPSQATTSTGGCRSSSCCSRCGARHRVRRWRGAPTAGDRLHVRRGRRTSAERVRPAARGHRVRRRVRRRGVDGAHRRRAHRRAVRLAHARAGARRRRVRTRRRRPTRSVRGPLGCPPCSSCRPAISSGAPACAG